MYRIITELASFFSSLEASVNVGEFSERVRAVAKVDHLARDERLAAERLGHFLRRQTVGDFPAERGSHESHHHVGIDQITLVVGMGGVRG